MEEQVASEYTGTFSQLAYCFKPPTDPLIKQVPSARAFFAQQIHGLATRAPGTLPALVGKADPRVGAVLGKYLTAAKLPALA